MTTFRLTGSEVLEAVATFVARREGLHGEQTWTTLLGVVDGELYALVRQRLPSVPPEAEAIVTADGEIVYLLPDDPPHPDEVVPVELVDRTPSPPFSPPSPQYGSQPSAQDRDSLPYPATSEEAEAA